MENTPTWKKYWPYALLALVALAARLLPGERMIDDAYITFRYAQNLLAGNGFVYNPGEHVFGTTTPLYTFLLAGLAALSGGPYEANFPQIAIWINALADVTVCMLLVLIGQKLNLRWASWAAASAWALTPYSVTFAIGGMETSVFMLLLVGLWAAYLHERYTLTGLLAALALLTRPDALILVLMLGFDRLFFDPKRRGMALSKQELAAFFVPIILWLLFAAWYFGSPLPHSISAKANAYQLPALSALSRFIQHVATPFQEHITLHSTALYATVLLYPFLFVIGARQSLRQTWAAWPFWVYPWAYMAAFAITNPLIFRWYLTPPLPFYYLGLLAGVENILANLTTQRPKAARWAWLPFIVPIIFLLNSWTLHPDHGPNRPAPEMAWHKLELLYTQVAQELQLEIAVRSHPITLAAGDVGALGYFSGVRILDTVGIMSPETLDYYPLPDALYAEHAYAIPPDLILDKQPDYLVTLEIYVRTGLLQDERFAEMYQLHHKIETDIYESDGMLIFVRKDIALP